MQQLLLRFLPLRSNAITSLLRPYRNLSRELFRHTHEPLRKFRSVRNDLVTLRILGRLDIKSPQDTSDAEEETSFGDVHAWADTSAGTKGELVALAAVRIGRGVVKAENVVLVFDQSCQRYILWESSPQGLYVHRSGLKRRGSGCRCGSMCMLHTLFITPAPLGM